MKTLLSIVVVLLCIQTLYADDPSSDGCTSNLATLRSNAEKYFKDFSDVHNEARNVSNNEVYPICQSIYAARAMFISNQKDNNTEALITAVKKFTDSAPQVGANLNALIDFLAEEVEKLSALTQKYTSSNDIKCIEISETATECEKELNALACAIKKFTDAVPDLAYIARFVLAGMRAAVAELSETVKRYTDIKNPTREQVLAFLDELGKIHDKGHGFFEMFKVLCNIVDAALKEITPKLK